VGDGVVEKSDESDDLPPKFGSSSLEKMMLGI